ncbi:glycosyl hydrolase family 18 protein [Streptomyces sp. NPDC031705]|uniref:glycosyl hydrolase family 18 protein n=1 Tax=Streptomyces sp. NPDC031705 TaxID=3155729 RepID=UPI0033CDC67E
MRRSMPGRPAAAGYLSLGGTAGKLTHVNHAFAGIGADGRRFTGNAPGEADAWADYARPLDAADSVFDGIDPDREWLGSAGDTDTEFRPQDEQNFAELVHGFRTQLDEELKPLVASGAFQVHRDPRAGHAWLFDGTTLWTHDDQQVLRTKARYVRQHALGGAMFRSLDADTPDGGPAAAVDQGLRGR